MEILIAAVVQSIIDILFGDVAEQPRLRQLREKLKGDDVRTVALKVVLAETLSEYNKKYRYVNSDYNAVGYLNSSFLKSEPVVRELAKLLTPNRDASAVTVAKHYGTQLGYSLEAEPRRDWVEAADYFINGFRDRIQAHPDLVTFAQARDIHELVLLDEQQVAIQRDMLEEMKKLRADFQNFLQILAFQMADASPAETENRPAATSATHATDPDDVPDKPRKLIGRDDLKADVTKLLEGGERVLLQGFGGQGKTALAATLGAEWVKAGKGSLLWLKTGSAAAEALFEALARPFGQHQAVARETGDNQIKVMRQILRGSGIKLLVLDDCWNGAALNTVLRAVPSDLPVLLTARQRYPIDGQMREVEQLAPPDALALLGYHANLSFPPSFDANPHPPAPSPLRREGESEAEKLCRVLGYHAFALEIAGKTLKANTWTAAELLKKIEAAPEQLEVPLDFRVEGRESVAKLIEVSLDALDEEARAVFKAMGAFFAPQMTAEMVMRFFVGTPEVSDDDLIEVRKQNPHVPTDMPDEELRKQFIDFLIKQPIDVAPAEKHLATLVQHGLVVRLGTPTPTLPRVQGREADVPAYRLHDLAYSYARAQNGDEQRGLALEACLAYVTRYNEPSLANFAALRPELDNLLNAASWAFGVGRVNEGEDFVDKLYIGPNAGGGFLIYQGLASQSTHLLQQSVDGHGKVGDKQKQGADLGNLGSAYSDLGQVEKAIGYYEQALTIQRDIGDKRGEGNQLGNLGNAYSALGQVEKAIVKYEQALTISREIGDRRNEGNWLGSLGNAYSALGQVEKAIAYYEQVLTISREIGDKRMEGNVLGGLGNAYKNLGQVEKTIEFYEQALSMSREIGDRWNEGSWLGNLGIAYSDLRQYDKADGYYQKSIQIKREIGDKIGEANDSNNIGALREDQGDYAAALDYFQQARAIYAEIGAQHMLKMVDENIAIVRAKLGGGGAAR